MFHLHFIFPPFSYVCSSLTLFLLPSPVADVVVAPPSNVYVRAGETIVLACAGIGNDPQISWATNGVTTTNGTDDRVAIYDEFNVQNGVRYIQSILEICSTQTSDEGVYECTVTSRTLSSSVNFTLSVNVTPAALVIGPADTYPIFNSSVFLTCVAIGYPLPTVMWYRNGERVMDTENIQSEVIEQGGERYVQSTLLACSVQETANYNCSVSNGVAGDVVTSVTSTVVVQGRLISACISTRSTLSLQAVTCYDTNFRSEELFC